MSQRIIDRLYGDEYIASGERIFKAHQTGEFIDQFTTIPQENPKVTLERLPKCIEDKENEN